MSDEIRRIVISRRGVDMKVVMSTETFIEKPRKGGSPPRFIMLKDKRIFILLNFLKVLISLIEVILNIKQGIIILAVTKEYEMK
jgi:hypothetical protein